MTATEPLVERLAEVVMATVSVRGPLRIGRMEALILTSAEALPVARALLPVVEQAVAAARAEALREAAKEAEERGDIGKDGGCEAWTWLRIRADRERGAL